MAVQLDRQNIGGVGGSSKKTDAKLNEIKDALELLSPDQSGALALAGKVNENEKKLSELEEKIYTKKSSGVAYIIESSKWGITEGVQEPNEEGHYTEEQYDLMYNNGVAIQNAVNYARDNGYGGIAFPRSAEICVTPNNAGVSVILGELENFDVNLNDCTIRLILDSTQRSKYYTKSAASYDYRHNVFFIHSCKNLVIHDGRIIGDRFIRKYNVTAEGNQEGTNGISVGGYVYELSIERVDASAFMADAISFGLTNYRYNSTGAAESSAWFDASIGRYTDKYYELGSGGGAMHPILVENNMGVTITDFIAIDSLWKVDTPYMQRRAKERVITIFDALGYVKYPNCFLDRISVLTYATASGEPIRLINSSYLGDITLNENEHFIKIQCYYDNDVKSGEQIDHKMIVSPRCNSGMRIIDCFIHDCGRGAIAGACNDTLIKGCSFNKIRCTNGGDFNPPYYGVSAVNYHIDTEDSNSNSFVVENCKFDGLPLLGRLLVYGLYRGIFRNCTTSGSISISKCVHLEFDGCSFGSNITSNNNWTSDDVQGNGVGLVKQKVVFSDCRFVGYPVAVNYPERELWNFDRCYFALDKKQNVASLTDDDRNCAFVYSDCTFHLFTNARFSAFGKLYRCVFLPCMDNYKQYASIISAELHDCDLNGCTINLYNTKLIDCKNVIFLSFVENNKTCKVKYINSHIIKTSYEKKLTPYVRQGASLDIALENCIVDDGAFDGEVYAISYANDSNLTINFNNCDLSRLTNAIFNLLPSPATNSVVKITSNNCVCEQKVTNSIQSKLAFYLDRKIGGSDRPRFVKSGSFYFDDNVGKLLRKHNDGCDNIGSVTIWQDVEGNEYYDGFTLLNGLKFTKDNYIDTGIKFGSKSELEVDYMCTDMGDAGVNFGGNFHKFSVRMKNSEPEYLFIIDKGKFVYVPGSYLNERIKVVVKNKSQSINGDEKSTSSFNYTDDSNFVINNSDSALATEMVIYSMKIRENGEIVRNYIPALDTNKKPCFYERVSNTFVYSDGAAFVE